MNKEQFIEKLRKKLNILEKKELDDIIEEYEGYLEEKKSTGMSEEEAVKSLGDINEITRDLLEAYKINENYDKKETNTIENFINGLVDGIESFIDSFQGRTFKDILKMFIQILFLCLIIAICKIPFSIIKDIGSSLFSSFNSIIIFGVDVFHILARLFEVIMDLLYAFIAIVFFLKIFKEKILGQVKTEKIEDETDDTFSDNKKKEKIYETKAQIETKNIKNKDFFDICADIMLLFVKFFVFIFAICNAFYLIGISAVLIIAIILMIKGVTYFGIILLLVALLIFGISFMELFIRFIFNFKPKYLRFLITIILSLVLGGAGIGLFATEIASSEFNKEFDDSSYKTVTDRVIFDEKTVSHYYDLEIDNSLKDEMKIVYEYNSDYIDLEPELEKREIKTNYGYVLVYDPSYNSTWSKKTYNKLIDDLKNKAFYKYDDLVRIKVYVNEENYNKIKQNDKKYIEYQRYYD